MANRGCGVVFRNQCTYMWVGRTWNVDLTSEVHECCEQRLPLPVAVVSGGW